VAVTARTPTPPIMPTNAHNVTVPPPIRSANRPP